MRVNPTPKRQIGVMGMDWMIDIMKQAQCNKCNESKWTDFTSPYGSGIHCANCGFEGAYTVSGDVEKIKEYLKDIVKPELRIVPNPTTTE